MNRRPRPYQGRALPLSYTGSKGSRFQFCRRRAWSPPVLTPLDFGGPATVGGLRGLLDGRTRTVSCFKSGDGGTRTHTLLREPDFESGASTNSTTSPNNSGAGGNRTRVQNAFPFTSYVACPYLTQRAGCPSSFRGVRFRCAPRRAFIPCRGASLRRLTNAGGDHALLLSPVASRHTQQGAATFPTEHRGL